MNIRTTVPEWVPDRRKKWRTTDKPRLIILGGFEMSFALTAIDRGTRLVLTIGYNLPPRGFGRLLGGMLAAPYARWCVRRMARNLERAIRRAA